MISVRNTRMFVVMAFLMAGCDFTESISEMSTQTEKVGASVARELGVKPQFGWNMKNGRLVEMTAYFDGAADTSKPVRAYVDAVKSSIQAHMEQQPDNLVVMFVVE